MNFLFLFFSLLHSASQRDKFCRQKSTFFQVHKTMVQKANKAYKGGTYIFSIPRQTMPLHTAFILFRSLKSFNYSLHFPFFICNFSSHLVNAVISVPIFWAVFAVFATFRTAHHPHRLPRLPVLCLSTVLLIHWRIAVQSQGPATVTPLVRTEGKRA